MVSGGGKYNQIKPEHDLCKIGNDVWIAAGAQILHKVKVGDGAVIGAGAVVIHEVPPYAIVVGVPAKVVGYRCDEVMRDKLLEIRWWEWPIDSILENYAYLLENDISAESLAHLETFAKSL